MYTQPLYSSRWAGAVPVLSAQSNRCRMARYLLRHGKATNSRGPTQAYMYTCPPSATFLKHTHGAERWRRRPGRGPAYVCIFSSSICASAGLGKGPHYTVAGAGQIGSRRTAFRSYLLRSQQTPASPDVR
ncbi:hypothetical protein PYCCODRAFT_510383 [Trametes coccinea BRFM310]|uniref:Uncharacterized protein n=1 Tax=Trametes coccinea (strain BRFM310) TaxID=1353009 RepID=A0A1Y2IJU5_TRAC3|nr:hypothetical protein PYCCODRAFT_510383 [Trametes coccinea BRFM310]